MDRIIELGKEPLQKYQNLPVLALILANMILIPFILTHYGESWDERHQYEHYANHALQSYVSWFQEGRSEGITEAGGVAKDLHGPAFVMTVELLTQFISNLNLGWHETDIRHFFHFITFQMGLFSLYIISRRWLSPWASLGTTLLYMTQPVFWGHGIINPKDMPFASLFLLSIALGLKMYDYLYNGVWEQVSAVWASLDTRLKWTIGLIVSIWAFSIVCLFAGTKVISEISTNIINSAYTGPNTTMIHLFSLVAKNFGAVPADIYIKKLFIFLLRLRGIYTILSTTVVLWLLSKRFWSGLRLLGLPVMLAGFVLGFATSMRNAGPLAGILIAIYIFGRAGRKAILTITIYGFVSLASMYITWPYLWGDPVGRLLESLQVMAAFPREQQVLFNGMYYPANALPVTYLPVLLAIQLTEPVWVLFLAGVTVTITGFIKKREYGGILLVLLGWFIIPILGFVIFRPSLYDNFRQVLFILPPIFLMAGVVFSKIKQPIWQIALITLVILPGIMDGIRLHPYEYIYYNRFIGGVNGAQVRFELDYWGTSYREAANYVNSIAPANAYVYVEGPAHIFNSFARRDLKVLDAYGPELEGQEYYFIALSRYNLDEIISPDAEIIYTVSVDGALLTVIKKP
ncbi:MAG: hypothetical protein HY863_04255 [Chloroflexi bacterium]|nr:hypothetical protein [Chloroflexota bacterium]